MLISGAIFLVTLGVLLVIMVVGKRKFTPLLPFFAFPIVMIGFPHITHVKIAGAELDTGDLVQSSEQFKKDPNNPAAATAFITSIAQVQYAEKIAPETTMSPETKSNLNATVNAVNRRKDLTPEARLAIVHAQLYLRETNTASVTLNAVVKEKPNIKAALAPRLTRLLN